MRVVFVLDTNVFLHAKSLHVLQWLQAAQRLDAAATEVLLVVAPVVLDELEKHKTGLEVDSFRQRASNAMELLAKLFRAQPDGDVELPKQAGVTVRLLKNRRIVEGGDHRFADDQLLGALRNLEETEKGSRIVLVTKDAGLQLRSRQRGFAFSELTENEWLPRGRGTNRTPSVAIKILFDGTEIVGDEALEGATPTTIRKQVVGFMNMSGMGLALARYQMSLQAPLNPTGRLMTAGRELPPDLKEKVSAAQEHATLSALQQTKDSLKFTVTVVVENTGGVRLNYVTIDPIEVQIGNFVPKLAFDDVSVGAQTAALDGLGLNPGQVANFRYQGELSGYDDFDYLLRVSVRVPTERVTESDEFHAKLEVRQQAPEIRLGIEKPFDSD